MPKKRLLIVEAHSDDSAISVGGFLHKFQEHYECHFLLIVVSSIYLHHIGRVSREQRLAEYQAYISHFNGIWHRNSCLPFDCDSRLDTLPKRDIVCEIEKVVTEVKPDMLICQGPSFHHDHTIVYESLIAATRPTARFCPHEIYIMENPTYVHSLGPSTDFKPDLYCSLNEKQINRKLEVFKESFPSQIRQKKNYLSEDGIKTWARYRGIEARCKYAEALMTYRRCI